MSRGPLWHRHRRVSCLRASRRPLRRTSVMRARSDCGQPPQAAGLVAVLLGSVICATAWGFDRDKSDLVTLHNGDHISGDIVSLQYGILTVKTNNMSTLNIE